MISNLNWVVGHGSDPMAMPIAEENQSWMKTNIPMQVSKILNKKTFLYCFNFSIMKKKKKTDSRRVHDFGVVVFRKFRGICCAVYEIVC